MAVKKKPTSSRKTVGKAYNSQFWSIVLFALGILTLLISIIKGESAWLFIHNVLLGLFGVSAFILPVVLIYASIMIATDRSHKAVTGKLIQGAMLILLVCGIIQVIFVGAVDGTGFLNCLVNLYDDGQRLKGGGLFSAVLGWPLLALFSRAGATIIILLLTFVFVMLLMNISLITFFGIFYKPLRSAGRNVVKMKEAVEQAQEEDFQLSPGAKRFIAEKDRVNAGKKPPNYDVPAEKMNSMLNIDIPINSKGKKAKKIEENEPTETDDGELLPIHPVISPKITNEKLKETIKNSNAELEELIRKAVILPDTEAAKSENPESKMTDSMVRNIGIPSTVNIPNTTNVPNIEKMAANPIGDSEPIAVKHMDTQAALYKRDDLVNVYKFPPITLLKSPVISAVNEDTENELKLNADTLVDTLKSFGVQTRIVDINRGPTVTRYELQPSAGVKISKITGLSDDIALNLAAAGVRIEAPIPGKAAVGIEIPNKNVDIVTMRELVETSDFANSKSKISFALGRDIGGNVVIADIGKMPHVLIAGSTGSGKSVCINSIIMSLLYKSSPDEVRILMIDPKVVELGIYNGIPHLLIPVVTDPRKAAGALSWAVSEMLKRYKVFADNNVRDLKGFNELAKSSESEESKLDPLPHIVIIIDELADLMMAAPGEVEDSICRLAQMARAAGMHLVIATQRPSVDVITGVIKANIPSRIAFAVSSQVDSRTILDGVGAEKLLGRGDMLFYPSGMPKPSRVQGCFVTDKEVEAVVSYIKNTIKADYDDNIMEEIEKKAPVPKGERGADSGSMDASDEMLEKAIDCVIEAGQASTSYLQRKLKLGYARAARIIDDMEELGIVGSFEGAKPRTILMSKEQWTERKVRSNGG